MCKLRLDSKHDRQLYYRSTRVGQKISLQCIYFAVTLLFYIVTVTTETLIMFSHRDN